MAKHYENDKSVATWITMKDFAYLQHLAFANNVTVASYIRAIIVDALEDERHRKPTIEFTKLSVTSPSV